MVSPVFKKKLGNIFRSTVYKFLCLLDLIIWKFALKKNVDKYVYTCKLHACMEADVFKTIHIY